MTVTPIDDARVAALLPVRDPDGHKGSFGTVIAVCGSLDYAGAGLLAASAALRAGAGLTILAVPASLQPVIAGRVPELVTWGLPEQAPGEVDAPAAAARIAAGPADALLVGPGLRPGAATAALVRALAAADPSGAARPPVVLDAEALNVLADPALAAWPLGRPAILTPHPGELARLDGRPPDPDDGARADRATALARRTGAIVVLKGARTVVAAPDGRRARSDARNPALATGGTGDILAGVIASLLAQGLAPWDAACAGVHLHAGAGERVAARIGDAGLLASDLLPEIPLVRRALIAGGGAGGR